ncbi:Murein DD-endopeptidase MepM and murein hydrolase activator NlpD, contain LysM domain [Pelagirhabdus alkalitolerans]|uniref:Murein DD-endopeptidase MepM and murein hydrolase activator NlpD, contain LysM domain n=1 Tax=Pelagirhabdus alkalitolerans TaxID=1612202 RepID=A0A1G6LF93_9BACI|nr:M23 family metallopeptidase [Pelagirhabdus alkalitolerans]SDC41843.1 Murein DD-endopeptidase MepM and murein hydrolase activator NlpD, contain LysM domain [Pelagirhabdus alkalitolerans]
MSFRNVQLKKDHLILTAFFIVLLALLAVSGLNQSTVAHADEGDMPMIHHVYVDGEHIGPVNDEEVIEDQLEERVEEVEQETDDEYSYGVKEEITYVSERVFRPSINQESTLEKLEDQITVEIAAVELILGDASVGYFETEEEAEDVIEAYKEQFIDEDLLETLDSDEDDELELDDIKITDVELSKDVEYEEEVVSEDELLTLDDALELLEKGTLEDQIHEVEAGDTLSSIASQYELSADEIIELNEDLDDDEAILGLGDELNVTDYAPFVDVIVYQEELVEETISYEREVEKSDDMFEGESETKQEGQDGKKRVHYALEIVNGEVVERETEDEEVVEEPVDEIIVEGTKVISSRGTGDFDWPAVGGYVSSGYGPRWGSHHNGIDIARPSNRDILAADNGVVERISYDGNGYGHYVVINHNNGYKTLYAHLSNVDVSVGQTVPQGSKIGTMGSTGRSTGIHLHFEVERNGSSIDPQSVL